jgi:hypothetical protein
MMEEKFSSETLVPIYQTHCHNLECLKIIAAVKISKCMPSICLAIQQIKGKVVPPLINQAPPLEGVCRMD